MKSIFNFFENILHLGELFGFYIAKSINKLFYGLIFSSFDESKEKLNIEKAKLENATKELEIKREELERDEKRYKERIEEVEAILKMENIDVETFEKLQEENEKLNNRLKENEGLLKTTQEELDKARKIAQLADSMKKSANLKFSKKEESAYAEEVKRLNIQIGTLESELEVLKKSKEYSGETLKSKVKEIKEPTLEKSKNPFKYLQNLIKYRRELKEFNKLVSQYIQIEKNEVGKSSKRYKADGIKEHERCLQIGDKYVRIYYLADFPNFLLISTLFKLINMPIPLTLSYHIKGTSKGAMIKAARQRFSVLESLNNERYKKGKSRDQEIEREAEEVNVFIDNLVHDLERVFLVSVYAVITADTEKQLLEYDQKFQDESSDIEFTFNTYSFGQQEAFTSSLPISEDIIKEDHLLQTSAVTNLLPFLTRNLNDPSGIFIGTNHYNNSLILIDLFKARNANMNIFGTSGSGKSVTAKLILERLTLRGVQSIILDPEGEYTKLTETMGGEVIKFTRDNGINPFFIGSASNDAVKDHISVLKHFFKFFIQEDRYDSAKLDKLLMMTYESETPNFCTFLDITKKEAKNDKEIRFVEDLEQLQTGSLSGIFNSEKQIRLNSDVICFDLSDLRTDEKKIPAMYLLGTIINRLIDDGARRRMIFIDEAHKLLVNDQTTVFYVDLVKTARKRKAGVVSITQNPEDFKESNNAKTILTQAETSILLKQAPSSINYIKEHNIFQLTDRELSDLPTFGVGEALFIREREHIYMNIFPFESERELVFTS